MIKNLLILTLLASCASKVKNKKPEPIQVIEPPSEHVFYEVKSSLSWMHDLAKVATCITLNKDFQNEVASIDIFEHSELNGKQVVESMLTDPIAVTRTYRKRFTRAAAYRKVGTNQIYLNTIAVNKRRDRMSMAPTLIHERLHVLGHKHKGNGRNKNRNYDSIPYKVGSIAKNFIDICK